MPEVLVEDPQRKGGERVGSRTSRGGKKSSSEWPRQCFTIANAHSNISVHASTDRTLRKKDKRTGAFAS
eukprot:1087246-Pleurochrysis_carterae.AAC.2